MSYINLLSAQSVLGFQSAKRRGRVFWQRVLHKVLYWHELARQRRQLASLSDAMLKDIGLSRSQAYGEANRRFWDEPKHQDPRSGWQ